jgi:hypothetical protein
VEFSFSFLSVFLSLCLNKRVICLNPKLKEFDEKLYKALEEHMPIVKAHNPLSDCYFTVIVLLVMSKKK